MQSAQVFLTLSLCIIWYSFCLLFVFDFLVGLPLFMQTAQLKRQQVELQLPESTYEKLPEANTVASNFGIAPRQYLETVGADSDFGSIGQARQFLDESALLTMETETQSSSQSTLPNPWFEQVTELPHVGETLGVEPFLVSKPVTYTDEQVKKLTFEQVQEDFAQSGWKFQKHRSGHYRYQVNVGGSTQKFKTLQEALDWLVASKSLMPTNLTQEFAVQNCPTNTSSDQYCELVLAEIQLLSEQGKFDHWGIYWIANHLAAQGRIRITLPKQSIAFKAVEDSHGVAQQLPQDRVVGT